MGEMFCQEYWAERGLKTAIARLHNVYGPHGSWDGGREKAPAAILPKGRRSRRAGTGRIVIWGDGTATRSFTYIDDCVVGIDRIHPLRCADRHARQPRLERAGVGRRAGIQGRRIAGVQLERALRSERAEGCGGRNSDNSLIRKILGWEPSTSLNAVSPPHTSGSGRSTERDTRRACASRRREPDSGFLPREQFRERGRLGGGRRCCHRRGRFRNCRLAPS
jgi:nucleoside-diphosphate-sugar epimerase